MNPQHPVYVVSKGRAGQQLTSRALTRLGVPHFVVVEAQERAEYEAKGQELATFLTLERRYQDGYDTFDDLGNAKSKGPGPARNFVWDHAIAAGATWHWVMDDNIHWFVRLNRNRMRDITDGAIFRAMEDFCDRFTNVMMAGPQYYMFSPRKSKHPPFVLNTRIYSCNLIRNDAPYRWRGRYNEDTDLSLRMLKDGYCTIQFSAFIQNKMRTQVMTGGNTQEFYATEGTLPKSRMLIRMHPDVAKLKWRFGRPHHLVDYSGFRRNRLRLKPGLVMENPDPEYGMVLTPKA